MIIPLNSRESRFCTLEIKLSGRTTHRLIAEVTDAWLQPEREDDLKETLHAMASDIDWTLDGRIPGDLREITYRASTPPILEPARNGDLTLWEIIAQ